MNEEQTMLLLMLIGMGICFSFGIGGLLWRKFGGARCPKCKRGRLQECMHSYFREPNPPLGYWTDVKKVCSSPDCDYEKFVGTFAGGG